MKVVLISHSYIPEINQQKLEKISEYNDVDLYLITPQKWKHKLKTYSIEYPQTKNYEIIPKRTLMTIKGRLYFFPSLTKEIREIKPDIIHIEEEPWSLSCFQAMRAKKISKSKTLFFTWENIYKNFFFPFSLIEKYNLKHADFAITGNQDAKEILKKKGFQKSIEVLPQLGVDPEIFKKQDASHLNERLNLNSFVIGFIGRLVWEKGLLTLIEAASKLDQQDYNILIVGRGELKADIINLAEKLGISNKIRFVDTVPHSEVPDYLNCMDVLVLPSVTTKKWKEQFGHVLIEAMACEVPVIGSNSGEIPKVIGDAGLVFQEKNAKDLSEKLSTIVQDEKLRRKLAKEGRKQILENYTWKRIAGDTHKVYQHLINH